MKIFLQIIALTPLFLSMPSIGNMFPEEINYALDARRASIVAEVRIVAGKEVLGPLGQRCSHSYEAEVVDPIKGGSKGHKIIFWALQGMTLGSSYVILLTEANSRFDKSFDPAMDFEKAKGRTSTKEICDPLVPPLRMMHVVGAYIQGIDALGEGRYVTFIPFLGSESPGLAELGRSVETETAPHRTALKVPLFKFKEYLKSKASAASR
jgi:hypothetical protein